MSEEVFLSVDWYVQMQWPLATLTSVLELVPFTWTTLAVMAVRGTSLIVRGVLLAAVTMVIRRMLE